MKNPKVVAALAVVAVVVVAAAIFLLRRGGAGSEFDLLSPDLLGQAVKRTGGDPPADGGTFFEVKDVTIAGQLRKAVYAPPHSRIIYKIQVPRRAVLTVYFGVREDAWSQETDGAQFRIGVSDGRTYEEYLREYINPKANDRDRRWFDATVDLSAYEGQQVELIFNTDPGPPKAPNTTVADYAVWAEPKVTEK